MTSDQAAGLRRWAARPAPEALDCPSHVAAMLLELAERGLPREAVAVDDGTEAVSGAAGEAPPRHVLEQLHELAAAEPPASAVVPRVTKPRGAAPPVVLRTAVPTLMVLGLPDASARQAGRVGELLAHWARLGRRWVGDPDAWKVVPIEVDSAHLPLLATQQPRWALWVGSDGEAFRRAWRLLIELSDRPGPRRLLLVHPLGMSRRGLLDNLQQAARVFLGIQLVVLA